MGIKIEGEKKRKGYELTACKKNEENEGGKKKSVWLAALPLMGAKESCRGAEKGGKGLTRIGSKGAKRSRAPSPVPVSIHLSAPPAQMTALGGPTRCIDSLQLVTNICLALSSK